MSRIFISRIFSVPENEKVVQISQQNRTRVIDIRLRQVGWLQRRLQLGINYRPSLLSAPKLFGNWTDGRSAAMCADIFTCCHWCCSSCCGDIAEWRHSVTMATPTSFYVTQRNPAKCPEPQPPRYLKCDVYSDSNDFADVDLHAINVRRLEFSITFYKQFYFKN